MADRQEAARAAKKRITGIISERKKLRCDKADFYRGMKPPRCNGGDPCKACLETYERAQSKGIVRNIVVHGKNT